MKYQLNTLTHPLSLAFDNTLGVFNTFDSYGALETLNRSIHLLMKYKLYNLTYPLLLAFGN